MVDQYDAETYYKYAMVDVKFYHSTYNYKTNYNSNCLVDWDTEVRLSEN